MAKFHRHEWTTRAENHRQKNSDHHHLGEAHAATTGGGPEPASQPGTPKLDGRGNGGGGGAMAARYERQENESGEA